MSLILLAPSWAAFDQRMMDPLRRMAQNCGTDPILRLPVVALAF